MQSYNKSSLMQLAQALRKTGLSLRDALIRAWKTIKLKAQMLIKPVSFFYKKDDGTERFAVGYYGAAPVVTSQKPAKPSPVLVVKYYDTLAAMWRSFRADRLILD